MCASSSSVVPPRPVLSISIRTLFGTFAHRWLSEGGQEQDLMRLAGWKAGRCSVGMVQARRISGHERHTSG